MERRQLSKIIMKLDFTEFDELIGNTEMDLELNQKKWILNKIWKEIIRGDKNE